MNELFDLLSLAESSAKPLIFTDFCSCFRNFTFHSVFIDLVRFNLRRLVSFLTSTSEMFRNADESDIERIHIDMNEVSIFIITKELLWLTENTFSSVRRQRISYM